MVNDQPPPTADEHSQTEAVNTQTNVILPQHQEEANKGNTNQDTQVDDNKTGGKTEAKVDVVKDAVETAIGAKAVSSAVELNNLDNGKKDSVESDESLQNDEDRDDDYDYSEEYDDDVVDNDDDDDDDDDDDYSVSIDDDDSNNDYDYESDKEDKNNSSIDEDDSDSRSAELDEILNDDSIDEDLIDEYSDDYDDVSTSRDEEDVQSPVSSAAASDKPSLVPLFCTPDVYMQFKADLMQYHCLFFQEKHCERMNQQGGSIACISLIFIVSLTKQGALISC